MLRSFFASWQIKTICWNLFFIIVIFAIFEFVVRTWFPIRIYKGKVKSPAAKVLGWVRRIESCQPPAPKITKDTIRILLLGDSVIDCNSYDVHERVPYYLAKRLGDRYLVHNISSGGWGTDQEYLAYQFYKERFSSDIVLLFFTPANDLYNNSVDRAIWQKTRKPMFILNAEEELELKPLGQANTVNPLQRYLGQSMAYFGASSAVKAAWKKWTVTEHTEHTELAQKKTDQIDSEECSHISSFSVPLSERLSKSWAVTKKILRKLRDEVKESGGEFAIVYVPSGLTFAYRLDRATECFGYSDQPIRGQCLGKEYSFNVKQVFNMLSEFSQHSGIRLIHNLERVKKYHKDHQKIAGDCLHLTPFGAQLLVDRIDIFVKSISQKSKTLAENQVSTG